MSKLEINPVTIDKYENRPRLRVWSFKKDQYIKTLSTKEIEENSFLCQYKGHFFVSMILIINGKPLVDCISLKTLVSVDDLDNIYYIEEKDVILH